MSATATNRYGLIRQTPDFNDWPYVPATIPPVGQPARVTLPGPIWDQGHLGSCTAHGSSKAAVYALAKAGAAPLDPARLFQYYNSRLLEGSTRSDAGATIRDAIKAINKYGLAPADLWPYDVTKFARKPPARAYKAALADVALEYYAVAQRPDDLRACLAEGYPIVIGFTVYASFETPAVDKTGIVPLPRRGEKVLGGHCVIVDEDDAAHERFGFTNSWSDRWGQQGRGYFPYAYLTDPHLSGDFWMLKRVGQG
jgi:C1A family cysteine protease